MIELKGKNVTVIHEEMIRREKENRAYLMKLTNENLLMNYTLEAGRFDFRDVPKDAHSGWESPVCQLRGHFLGHWLSGAAFRIHATGDDELKAKANAIIAELAKCQEDNGGGWIGAIPEKYMDWIAKGKPVWAPQYNLHKLLMGLVDLYLYAGNQQALDIADRFADWFVNWSGKFTREQFDNILDVETGGMLEVWTELLDITGKEKYRTLMGLYYRVRLFQPLLEGKDPLTNMHANTTIPEVLGCARAYEVTGEQRWMDIVKAYWDCAVTQRGAFATGGQTAGEIWTPKMKLKLRLGDKNQEHCTVYNMIRLAGFLFRHSGDPSYAQYMEYNLYNGIMAQTYYREYALTGNAHNHPETGLLSYFLPMKAGLHKDWHGETDSFFCCHGTMVQANAALNGGIYYQDRNVIYVCQYCDSSVSTAIGDTSVKITQLLDRMNGSMLTSSNTAGYQAITGIAATHENMPQYRKHIFTINTPEALTFTLQLRIPDWIASTASVFVNGEFHGETADSAAFYRLARTWKDGDQITVLLPITIRFIPLPDDENTGAFRYGPDVLAGICPVERVLLIEGEDAAEEITMENEREWGRWRFFFKTVHQEPAISFRRLRDIGYEPMQIYFQVKRKQPV
jgi:DUF1680 family protein